MSLLESTEYCFNWLTVTDLLIDCLPLSSLTSSNEAMTFCPTWDSVNRSTSDCGKSDTSEEVSSDSVDSLDFTSPTSELPCSSDPKMVSAVTTSDTSEEVSLYSVDSLGSTSVFDPEIVSTDTYWEEVSLRSHKAAAPPAAATTVLVAATASSGGKRKCLRRIQKFFSSLICCCCPKVEDWSISFFLFFLSFFLSFLVFFYFNILWRWGGWESTLTCTTEDQSAQVRAVSWLVLVLKRQHVICLGQDSETRGDWDTRETPGLSCKAPWQGPLPHVHCTNMFLLLFYTFNGLNT